MCSPKLSFLMNKVKKIFHKDGIQSHSTLAKHFGVDEDKLLKVDYDWTTKTIDVYGDNEEQNETCAFTPKVSHYNAIESFINEKVGTKEKLKRWLKLNWNDKEIRKESINILNEEGQDEYTELLKGKKCNLNLLKRIFDTQPTKAWCL